MSHDITKLAIFKPLNLGFGRTTSDFQYEPPIISNARISSYNFYPILPHREANPDRDDRRSANPHCLKHHPTAARGVPVTNPETCRFRRPHSGSDLQEPARQVGEYRPQTRAPASRSHFVYRDRIPTSSANSKSPSNFRFLLACDDDSTAATSSTARTTLMAGTFSGGYRLRASAPGDPARALD